MPRKAKSQDEKTLKYMQSQMESEYVANEKLLKGNHDALGQYTYAWVCAYSALHWVNGDPSTAKFPPAFQQERLVGACKWLKGLKTKKAQREALAGQLKAFQKVYPVYIKECGGMFFSKEIIETTWDGVISIFGETEEHEKPVKLPKFHCKSSEDFHLIVLSIVHLNKKLGKPLLNLQG